MTERRKKFEIQDEYIIAIHQVFRDGEWVTYDRDYAYFSRLMRDLINFRKQNASITERNFYPQLPDNVSGRIVAMDGMEGRETVVVEVPPAVRPMILHSDVYHLAFPWIIFVIDFVRNDVRVFYRNEPMSSLRDPVYLTNFTNAYGVPNDDDGLTGGMCMGWYLDEDQQNASISERISIVLDIFWNTSFNSDGSSAWRLCANIKEHPKSHEQWQAMSKINPKFILSIPWIGETTLAFQNKWVDLDDIDDSSESPDNDLFEFIAKQIIIQR